MLLFGFFKKKKSFLETGTYTYIIRNVFKRHYIRTTGENNNYKNLLPSLIHTTTHPSYRHAESRYPGISVVHLKPLALIR